MTREVEEWLNKEMGRLEELHEEESKLQQEVKSQYKM